MTTSMHLIVGLGNPGIEYDGTRHNIGRATGVMLQKKIDFPAFHQEKKWNAEVSEGKIGKEKIVILLPRTFMNKSGAAVAVAARFYKIKPAGIVLIHDDADIPLGRAKLSFGRSSAGHKGVESVLRALKTKDIWRFRLGIAGKKDIPAEKIVLKRFTPDETRLVKKVLSRTTEAIEIAIIQSPEIAMNEYNTR